MIQIKIIVENLCLITTVDMANRTEKVEIIKNHIKSYPDFPISGVLFRDMFSVLQKPEIFTMLNEVLLETAKEITPKIECIVGLDARGFLIGPLLSLELKVPFVPIRKKNKLPGNTITFEYEKEYGKDVLEIQAGSIQNGANVLIVDDLLATGGSMAAACELVRKAKGEVVACFVIMELRDLKGRQAVNDKIISLIKY